MKPLASGFTYLPVDYPVNPLLEDLASIPEASTDLGSWSTGSIEVTPLPDNRRRAVARGFQPFLRLRVSLKSGWPQFDFKTLPPPDRG